MKLKHIINEEMTPAVKTAISNIEKYTNSNNHGLATLELAKLLGNTKVVKILKNIIEIHKLEGHMPHHLLQYRMEIRKELFDDMKRKFDDETYNAIYSAF